MSEWAVVAFTPAERLYLAALLGMEQIDGAGDPFAGWTADQVEFALYRIRRSLVRHEVIRIGKHGVAVEPWAVELIKSCAGPRRQGEGFALRALVREHPHHFRPYGSQSRAG
ncbi:MAG: hypothetical protein ACOY93_03445 [Bacillota bacterium]